MKHQEEKHSAGAELEMVALAESLPHFPLACALAALRFCDAVRQRLGETSVKCLRLFLAAESKVVNGLGCSLCVRVHIVHRGDATEVALHRQLLFISRRLSDGSQTLNRHQRRTKEAQAVITVSSPDCLSLNSALRRV